MDIGNNVFTTSGSDMITKMIISAEVHIRSGAEMC